MMDRQERRRRARRATAGVVGRRQLLRAASALLVGGAVLFGGAIDNELSIQPLPAYASTVEEDRGPTPYSPMRPQGKSCFAWGPPAPPEMV